MTTDFIDITDILFKSKYSWYSTPTLETTVVLLNRAGTMERAYLIVPKEKVANFVATIPESFVVLNCAISLVDPTPSEIGNIEYKAYGPACGNELNALTIRCDVAWENYYASNSDWKQTLTEALCLEGDLPPGILFDKALFLNDVAEFIDDL